MYPDDTQFIVYEFIRNKDDEDAVIIGHPLTGKYLSIPTTALEVVDLLSKGKTFKEVCDIEDLSTQEIIGLTSFLEKLELDDLLRSKVIAKLRYAIHKNPKPHQDSDIISNKFRRK